MHTVELQGWRAYFIAGGLGLSALSIGCGDDGPLIIVPGEAGAGGASGREPTGNGGSGAGTSSDGGTAGDASSGGVGGSASPGGSGNGGSGSTTSDGGTGGIDDPGPPAPPPPATTGPLGTPLPDDEAQTWVFDDAEVHTYQLTLDPGVWAALQANARDEEYAAANLSAGGAVVGQIGLRFKGSLGTLASCFADDGTMTCSKLSMKLKFDNYLPEQRFAGLKRLNFNSMTLDDSQLHERIAYRVYREMGVVAPRAVHARLVINGEDWGLFSLVEEVDGRFTKNHFAAGNGNLYKEAWPSNADESILQEALETNEDIADHSAFRQFQADLLAATPEQLPNVVATYLNVDDVFAYLAVDRSIVNWDGLSAFYCIEGFCENHNYYWYQDESTPTFALIPWDLDNTFETVTPLDGIPGSLEVPADCTMRYSAFAKEVMPSGCDPLLQGFARTDRSRYTAQLDRLLSGPFAEGEIEGWIDAWRTQLEPEVATDSRGPGLETFDAAVARLLDALGTLRERALADRNAQP